ncbi:MAG TPA: DUF4255 domain-containing protein [Accumulibacter sp.]|jgi:hypothetical protein|nr:DUF4255 domain-containing protein [Accumulibacter sp.]HQC81681.1 DUF4255 domain-containing protein [Accumulibacter sp.]
MFIAGASASLKRLLEDRLVADGGLDGYTVSLFSTRNFTGTITNRVALFLYRVEVDETRRNVDLARVAPNAPRRAALGLELHYLLTVWGSKDAEGEQLMLARCMDILDRHALLSGALLAPNYPWERDDALRISLSHLSTEDMLRLWDSLEPPYQLSVPYVLRTARLAARELSEPSITDTRTLLGVPAVP